MSTRKTARACAQILVFGLLLIGISLLPEGKGFAQGQISYLYSNNNSSGSNSIGRFRIEADGSLTSLGNTPTGGNSNTFTPSGGTRVVVIGNFLYATNAQSRSLSGFTINPSNGDLASAFSPIVFPPIISPVSQSPHLFLSATPDGRFLYLMLETTIECLSINQMNGQLTPVGTFVPVINGTLSGMTVSRNGSLLAVSSFDGRQIVVARINATTGLLTQSTGSPYSPVGNSRPASLDFNAAGDRLFVVSATSSTTTPNLNAVQVGSSDGTISGELAGSPFPNPGFFNAQDIRVSRDGRFLYMSCPTVGKIASYSINADGTPTPIIGSPASYPAGLNNPQLVLHPAGTFIYSTLAIPGAITANAISGGMVGATVGKSPYFTGTGVGVGWLATYSPSTGPRNINDQVTFTVTSQALSGTSGGCATLGYTNRYIINADLQNIGANTFANPFFQVLSLRQKNGVTSPNPFRLCTADDFNPTLCTGGLVGTTQAISGPISPAQVVQARFEIEMSVLSRFEFTVGVFATVTSTQSLTEPVNRKGRTQVSRIGNLKVEVTGFDKAGNPLLTATFIPEKGMEGQFQVAGVRATLAK